MTKIFIDGSAGTTGLRIHERMEARGDVEFITIPEEERKELSSRKEACEKADVCFLCLPDSAAKEIVGVIENPDVKIIDTSTAHRTNELWAYGFPELSPEHKEKIIGSKRIAVPGCHASGFLSIVSPLRSRGVLDRDYPVVAHSITGYSGGGKGMIKDYSDQGRDNELSSPRQYGLTQTHKHLPEMKAVADLAYEPFFSPIVANFYSGMVVTVPVLTRLLRKKYTAKDIWEILSEHYEGQKLISVLPFGTEGFLGANNMSGKDSMEIIVSGNDERVLIASRFDNLGKGASGAAVQCFNLISGSDETEGLCV